MNKKTIFAILCCLVLGAGVLHSSSGDADQARADSTADSATSSTVAQPEQVQPEIQTAIQPMDEDATQCLVTSDVASGDSLADVAARYECPPFTSYCRKTQDCDAANGEICQNGCCYAAF